MIIHPTAVVAEDALLGADVKVGPYAVIESGAVLGDGCVVEAHAFISRWVRMGTGNTVGVGAVLGGNPQDLRFDPATESYVQIGNGNQFREHCTLHRGSKPGGVTLVGDGNFLMVGVHLGHDVQLGNKTVLANGVMLGGHVSVEDGVFFGGGTLVHQFVRIGKLAITQGNSSLSKDLPPFLMASELNAVVGLNVVGLKRAGFSSEQRSEVKEAFSWVYRRGYNLAQALDLARSRHWGVEADCFWRFIENTGKRGICGWRGRHTRRSERANGDPAGETAHQSA
jgi:UDP-N-acetylglucosamine acyltransferase